MAIPSVMHGARGKVGIVDPATGQTRIIGIFSSCSYGHDLNVQPAYILGRSTAGALEFVDSEVINITCTGFRVIGHGPYKDAGMPTIQQLLTAGYISLTLIDRKTEVEGGDPRIAKFNLCKCAGYSTGVQARNLSDMTVNYKAIVIGDEFTDNNEGPGATSLP